ncbi:hypothetical protein BASA50_005055 [Batrachochytrium salamandrivorans]|uniref:Uncharacterized protein n=1 Tax=Batrachochytrium salamandrivorans TaxID=1357716 RepID=A0ABQ8FGT3_9FUNG|nr:hypothetical protein BASA50_005055 [Batrachochytrium salamandrivorans]
MKFNILVVAAMVITSVNAGWHRRPKVVPGSDDSKPGSVSSHDLSEGDSSLSQDTVHTNKESSNDSDTNVVSENIFCDFLTLAAKDLQRNLVERADEFRDHLASLHMLQEKEDTLKDEQMENHSASTERVNGILEAIKEEFAKLQKEYREVWEMLKNNGCLVEDYYLIDPQDMARVGLLLELLQETPRNASVHGDDVISLDRK